MSADFVLRFTTMKATTLLIHRYTPSTLQTIPPVILQSMSCAVIWQGTCCMMHNDIQGKRHQQNLAKRAAREAAEKPALPQPNRRATTKQTVKIGRPGYKVTKQYDPETMQRSLLFQVSPQPHCDRLWLSHCQRTPLGCNSSVYRVSAYWPSDLG